MGSLWIMALAVAGPSFEKDVLPLLSANCVQCHGARVKMGNLDLRGVEGMKKGGTKGSALVAGNAARSLLYRRIADQSMPMGPKKLAAAEVRIIRDWIDAGASGSGVAGGGGRHWAFLPPKKPAVPKVNDPAWVKNPVDAFVLAQLEKNGIKPVARADGATLARRVHLDLTGLPPESDGGDYDSMVERLLASPQYGERWGRRWLDVVRYAESNGYERDGTKPNVWRYRDWVIDAFNKDKPYDRFVTEQLAGDEVEGSNAETQLATTFLRLGTWDDEPAEPMLDRFDQLDDVLSATAQSFMGITLRCARCHDHKFEPFSQRDYYRTLAVFEPLKRPQKERAEYDRLVGTEPELAAYDAAKQKADTEAGERRRNIEDLRKKVFARLVKEKRPVAGGLSFLDHAEIVLAFGTPEDRRSKQQKEVVEKFNKKLDEIIAKESDAAERTSLDRWKLEIAAIGAARPKEPPRGYIWYEDSPVPPVTRLLTRGDPFRPGEVVDPGVPAVLGAWDPAAIQQTNNTTGRRLWFARWLTSKDNPLLARVMVNRIWSWHFGEGLVASENDFGVIGSRPTHPELLDWLAVEFIESGWSVKHIQRLILKSNTFQLSADWNEGAGKFDAENRLLWRWKPRRVEAEVVRDAMLAVSGKLNGAMAGPGIYPKLPQSVLDGQSVPGQNWGKSEEKESSRRSVYIFSKRSLAVPELELLDTPDTTTSCEQRTVSTTGPQALTFLNGEFTHGQAAAFAARLRTRASDAREQVALAYRLALGRRASEAEIRAGMTFLGKQTLESFCLVVLNSNEFFYY